MLREQISFLTTLPVKEGRIEEIARSSWLFPVVGLIIGSLVYVIGLISFKVFPLNIASLVTLTSLYLITGLIHPDGLADFSDGLMANGDVNRKIAAMKDVKIGISGTFSLLIILLFNLFSIREICSTETGLMFGFFSAIIVSEVSAKLGMYTILLSGKGIGDGIGSIFINNISRKMYPIGVLISIILALSVSNYPRFLIVFAGAGISFLILYVADRSFGGINGDAIGATNELARTVTLILWAIL